MFLEEDFAKRLAELRAKKKVSARDMSLSIGQCSGYISNIENGHNLPSILMTPSGIQFSRKQIIHKLRYTHGADSPEDSGYCQLPSTPRDKCT